VVKRALKMLEHEILKVTSSESPSGEWGRRERGSLMAGGKCAECRGEIAMSAAMCPGHWEGWGCEVPPCLRGGEEGAFGPPGRSQAGSPSAH